MKDGQMLYPFYNIISQMNQTGQQCTNNEPINIHEATQHKLLTETTPQCRICLDSAKIQNEADGTLQLISPCRCTGSLKYIHEVCLQSWITRIVNKSHKKVSSGKAHIYCELCKSKIFFKVSKSITCKTKQQMKIHFLENIKTFILLMLLLLINLGFFSALLNYLLFVGFTILQQNNVVLVSLIISGQVLFSIVATVTTVCIVNKYLLSRKLVVLQIVRNEAPKSQNMRTQQNMSINQNEKIFGIPIAEACK